MFFVSAWREESCLAGSRREEIKLSLREVKSHKSNFKVCERLLFPFSVSLLSSLTGIFLWFLFLIFNYFFIIIFYPTLC